MMFARTLSLAAALGLGLAACQSDPEEEVIQLQAMGGKDDSSSPAVLRSVATSRAGLSGPSDLAFNPRRAGELWIVNHDDNSVVIVHGATQTTGRKTEYRKDGYATHFMATPTSIDFGADATTFGVPGTFATCGESRNTYDDSAPPNDFMGPTLWSSDLSIFAKQNPMGLGSHIDMLHETPMCMGIVHQEANIYWAIGGFYGGVYKYDFGKDHGVGRDDHSDGKTLMYGTRSTKIVPGIPSHLAYSASDKMLYIADTGHSRIVRLDTTTGRIGPQLPSPEPLRAATEMVGADFHEVVAASTGLLKSPSGLELHDGQLWVSDNANGRISVFTLAGVRVKYFDTRLPAGSLGGMVFGPDGKLYLVDMQGDRVFRLEPK